MIEEVKVVAVQWNEGTGDCKRKGGGGGDEGAVLKYLMRVHSLQVTQTMAVDPSIGSPLWWSTAPDIEATAVQRWRGRWVKKIETLGHNWHLQLPSWIAPVMSQLYILSYSCILTQDSNQSRKTFMLCSLQHFQLCPFTDYLYKHVHIQSSTSFYFVSFINCSCGTWSET